jgi:hypothetical protein
VHPGQRYADIVDLAERSDRVSDERSDRVSDRHASRHASDDPMFFFDPRGRHTCSPIMGSRKYRLNSLTLLSIISAGSVPTRFQVTIANAEF